CVRDHRGSRLDHW
nr:immunoglobulin heavy chain junction region [Macaca mulatta]